MLKIDLTSEPGGVKVNWRVGEGLSLHRRDGTLILKINASYADERSLMTAAHTLNFMFRSLKNAHATAREPSATDPSDHTRDGGKA